MRLNLSYYKVDLVNRWDFPLTKWGCFLKILCSLCFEKTSLCLRPYHVENTSSRLITEFQNHMRKQAITWLLVSSVSKLLRPPGNGREIWWTFIKSSEGGTVGGKMLQDCWWCLCGGKNSKEAAENYLQILSKLHNANFPHLQIWKEGGFLKSSPQENQHSESLSLAALIGTNLHTHR